MSLIFSWLLNGVYTLLLLAVSPILIFRRWKQGKYRRGWAEKLTGRLSRRFPDRICLWFHAVSVGEVVQLQTVLEKTEQQFPDAELFITVTTETGYDVAKSKYPQHTISYFPLDFSWAVCTALSRIRPDMIVLVELELWPNFVFAAHRQQIPIALINGRIGEKSFRGYSRIRPLMRRILACFDVIACQTETYANRLKSLGAPAERVFVSGNIKFDHVVSNRSNPKTTVLRTAFGLADDERVLIAGSTQAPEETFALNAWKALQPAFPNLRLILVPRHQERFEEVAALIREQDCSLIRRSDHTRSVIPPIPSSALTKQPPVILLDTLGELAACWGLADIAFVGGSLTNRGGQNMIEPAGYGAAVLFGPNTWNFKDITEALLSHTAAQVVRGPDELRDAVRHLLLHPEVAQQMGQAASRFVASQQGATQRTVDLITAVLQSRIGSSDFRPGVDTLPMHDESTVNVDRLPRDLGRSAG